MSPRLSRTENPVFAILGECVKMHKATISLVISAHLHETTSLMLDGLSRSLYQETAEICRKNSSSVKQNETLYIYEYYGYKRYYGCRRL
jgi:hypothetical protein